jgi:exodeoxyribonuclease-3
LLTVVGWNVNSLRVRLPLVLRYLDAYAPDVVCLQETRIADAAFPREPFAERGYAVVTACSSSYAGVAIASREPIDDSVAGIPGFNEDRAPGRRLGCRIGNRFIDTVYVPTRTAIGKVAFLDALRDDYAVRFRPRDTVVLAGDFNICFDARDYASPSMISAADVHPGRPEDLAFRGLVDRGLVDCFRHRNAEPGHFTWFPMATWAMKRNWGMRLDYVFASPGLAERVVDVVHDRETRTWPRPSDHLPVRARFDV